MASIKNSARNFSLQHRFPAKKKPPAGRIGELLLLLPATLMMLCICACSGIIQQSGLISITPASTSVSVGQRQVFVATVTRGAKTSPAWAVNGMPGGNATVGTISSSGSPTGLIAAYTAPAAIPAPATVTVTAVSQSDPAQKASAAVKIGPLISISAPLPIVQTYGTLQFSASVIGVSNTAVTWQVSCHEGGAACGAISQIGLYKAPNSVPTIPQGNTRVTDSVSVTAASQADPAFSGSLPVTITSPNQQRQSAPIQLGTSGSNATDICVSNNSLSCTTGTLGALLARAGKQYILSNNHVLAKRDSATIGDPIIQPGLGDVAPECQTAGTTIVAHLSQFSNLQAGTGPKVDAAMAEVVAGAVDTSGLIEGLDSTVVDGVPQAGAPARGSGITPSINELVAKSGRTTGVTCASIEAVDVSTPVQYQRPCSASSLTVSFTHQVAVGGAGFTAGGDSGSLIVDGNTAQPVALLFAADATTALGNPVSDVLNALKDANNNLPTFVGGAPHSVAACSLPPPSSAIVGPVSPAAPPEVLQAAEEVKNRHAFELLANPAVAAVGVGPSLDAPGEAAVLVFVQEGASPMRVPPEIEGIRTRLIKNDNSLTRGLLNQEETAQLVSQAGRISLPTVPNETVQSAIAIKEKRAPQLITDPVIQGVGVSASLDGPGDAAVILYIVKGKSHKQIPVTIDGLRTRIKETTGFYAEISNNGTARGCSAPPRVQRLGPSLR
jgi:hypothetical protein